MNTIGNLGGAVAGSLTGYILNHAKGDYADKLGVAVDTLTKAQIAEAQLPGYHINFVSYAVVYCVAIGCWFLIDATKPIADE
jgi:hypothetical protein